MLSKIRFLPYDYAYNHAYILLQFTVEYAYMLKNVYKYSLQFTVKYAYMFNRVRQSMRKYVRE